MTSPDSPADSSSTSSETPAVSFRSLGLTPALVDAVEALGYEAPTPVQEATIPALLEGRDVIAQAQTGTGKTAAFALPILARLDPSKPGPQALVLAPTRELAMQVAESFMEYARPLRGVRIATLYGGASFSLQLRDLQARPSIVVGTPGRLIDHIERESLNLENIRWLVLDEADEMLRMGFIEDVTRIIEATPETRATLLFSATMPDGIHRVAQNYLRDPVEVRVESEILTAETVEQYWIGVRQHERFGLLLRLLETEPVDGVLVFVRTKAASAELANNLVAAGIVAAPLSGDLSQPMREATVERLKRGEINVLVATDVAARGLDVERITHVINYDRPFDSESYIHRIGRTGRAGREGTAILFLEHRDRFVLGRLERATGQRLEQREAPSSDEVNEVRLARFKERIARALESRDLEFYEHLLDAWSRELGAAALEIAAALALVAQGGEPLLLPPDAPRRPPRPQFEKKPWERRPRGASQPPYRGPREPREFEPAREPRDSRDARPAHPQAGAAPDENRPFKAKPGFKPGKKKRFGAAPGSVSGSASGAPPAGAPFRKKKKFGAAAPGAGPRPHRKGKKPR